MPPSSRISRQLFLLTVRCPPLLRLLQTRVFAGESARALPEGGLTEEHLALAIVRRCTFRRHPAVAVGAVLLRSLSSLFTALWLTAWAHRLACLSPQENLSHFDAVMTVENLGSDVDASRARRCAALPWTLTDAVPPFCSLSYRVLGQRGSHIYHLLSSYSASSGAHAVAQSP